jgi:hypothetical protein
MDRNGTLGQTLRIDDYLGHVHILVYFSLDPDARWLVAVRSHGLSSGRMLGQQVERE